MAFASPLPFACGSRSNAVAGSGMMMGDKKVFSSFPSPVKGRVVQTEELMVTGTMGAAGLIM